MDKIYLGTNTKMYKTIKQTEEFVNELYELTADLDKHVIELFVIPSYTALHPAVQIAGDRIRIGAQNMGWEVRGQFTGEISPLMIGETGASLIMVGHSERRHMLRETDEDENKKVLCALQHKLKVLLCIGESCDDKEQGISRAVLEIQLKKGLKQVEERNLDHVWVAYEPVWAIGEGGAPATAEYVALRHREIKQILRDMFGTSGGKIPVLYGGSVNLQNAVELSRIENVNGLFIGRSAWDASKFNKIIRAVMSDNE